MKNRARPTLAKFLETVLNVQRRMADYYFARAESWEELVEEHERYNAQRHEAHEDREDGKRSPSEGLGPVRVVRYRPVDLERAIFSARFTRKVDTLGCARFRHWRISPKKGSPPARSPSGSGPTG